MTIGTIERKYAEILTDPDIPPVFARSSEDTERVGSVIEALSTSGPGFAEFVLPQGMAVDDGSSGALMSRVADVAERGPGLTLMGYAPLTDKPVLISQPRAVVMPLALDPHFQKRALGMPWEVRRQVRSYAKAGVEIDTFYIGHELDAKAFKLAVSRPDLLVTQMERIVGEPKVDPVAQRVVTVTSKVARYGGAAVAVGVVVPAVVVAAIAAAAAAVAAVAALGPVVAAGALLASSAPAAGLDPVLIGAVTPDGSLDVGQGAAFFHVASWR